MDMNINFPNLHIYLSHVAKTFHIFGDFSIALYGVCIAIGMVAGYMVASMEAKRSGQDPDTYFDLAWVAIICSLIGARVYYVIFAWDRYKDNPISVFYIREGGLAIYGGVIAAIITTYLFCKKRKLLFPLVCDTAGLGLITGQIIGRWGNFFNREVFGDYSDGLLAMQLPLNSVRSEDLTQKLLDHTVVIDGVNYIQVHPTFLYESLWNLALLLFLCWYIRRKRFDGEVFLMYLCGYGIGRFWIEWVRTDQLKIPGTQIPVSMAIAAIMVIISALWIAYAARHTPKAVEVVTDEQTKDISADSKQ